MVQHHHHHPLTTSSSSRGSFNLWPEIAADVLPAAAASQFPRSRQWTTFAHTQRQQFRPICEEDPFHSSSLTGLGNKDEQKPKLPPLLLLLLLLLLPICFITKFAFAHFIINSMFLFDDVTPQSSRAQLFLASFAAAAAVVICPVIRVSSSSEQVQQRRSSCCCKEVSKFGLKSRRNRAARKFNQDFIYGKKEKMTAEGRKEEEVHRLQGVEIIIVDSWNAILDPDSNCSVKHYLCVCLLWSGAAMTTEIAVNWINPPLTVFQVTEWLLFSQRQPRRSQDCSQFPLHLSSR